MALRYARTHENGLVVAPPRIDCLGPRCFESAFGEGCYVSHHHLYFPEHEYRSELEREFRDNAFNIVGIPRCVHTLYHQQIDAVATPSVEVMEQFLQQAEILTDLGVFVTDLAFQEDRLAAPPQTRPWSRVEFSPKGRPYFEYIRDDRQLKVQRLVRQAIGDVSVVPLRQVIEPHVVGARALQPVLDLSIAS